MDNKEIEISYKPWITFIDQSESYVTGFEAGMIYQKMQDSQEIDQIIHENNQGQIEAIANKLGYKYETEILGGGWVHFTAYKNIRRIK